MIYTKVCYTHVIMNYNNKILLNLLHNLRTIQQKLPVCISPISDSISFIIPKFMIFIPLL